MNRVAIYIETQDGGVKQGGLELATLVRQSGCEGVGILMGGDAERAAEQLAPFGLKEIWHVTGDAIRPYHPEIYAAHLARLLRERECQALLATDAGRGKDLLPRVASELEAPLVTDCIGVDLEKREAVKPQYAGKVNARMHLNGPMSLYALRPNTVTPERNGGGPVEVTLVPAAAQPTRAEMREVVQRVTERVDLTEAQTVVAGGYGLGSAEGFRLLQPLADALGAALGASRRAVDEGFVPYELQVGQTGKVVNPQLYIACGISGAVQHLAGMKSSRVIVAINRDPDAPIFKKAHYGIVGDLFELVPRLTEAFQEARGHR